MLPYSKRVECTSGMLRPSFQRRMPPIAIARFGGSLMPVTYCIPLIRWTSKSPATPVPYSFQQRQRANIRGIPGRATCPSGRLIPVEGLRRKVRRWANVGELYLKGRYYWNKRMASDINTAISYFNQAIARDPGYALAYSGLADAYGVLPSFSGNPSEAFPKSNAATRRALELDASLAHPHAVLGTNEMD